MTALQDAASDTSTRHPLEPLTPEEILASGRAELDRAIALETLEHPRTDWERAAAA